MESDAAPSPRPSIVKPDARAADFAALQEAALSLEALYHFNAGDSVQSDDGIARMIAAERQVRVLMARVFDDCTELGPPSPIAKGNLPNGDLVWACGHDPQHLYDLRTGEMLE